MLTERVIESRLVSNNSTEYYHFNVKDDVDKITIILNSHTGNSNLFVSKSSKRPSANDWQWRSANNIFTPNIITIERKSEKRPINGTYYIGVYGKSFSAYRIQYFATKYPKDTDKIPTDGSHIEEIDLPNGIVMRGFLNPKENYKVYKMTKKDSVINDVNLKNRNDKIFLTRQQSYVNLYVYTEADYYKNINEKTGKFENFKFKNSNFTEIIIPPSSNYYVSNGAYYVVVARSYINIKFPQYQTNCTFYITGVHTGEPMQIHEGISELVTLQAGINFKKQQFYVDLTKDNNVTVSVNVLHGSTNLRVVNTPLKLPLIAEEDVKPTEGDSSSSDLPPIPEDRILDNYEIPCEQFCKVWVDYESYCNKEHEHCRILIDVTHKEEDKAQFSKFLISSKSGNSAIPNVLNFNKKEAVMEKDKHYYYKNVDQSEAGSVIYFTFTQGIGNVYARLVKSVNYDYLNENELDDESMTNFDFPENQNQSTLKVGPSLRGGLFIRLEKEELNKCTNVRGDNDIEDSDLDSKLDKSILDNLKSKNNTCVLLITVKGKYSYSNDHVIYYNIDFGQGVTSFLSLNTPLHFEIGAEDLKYYSFSILEKIDVFTITMTIKEGSSQMMLNKGNVLPLTTYGDKKDKAHWHTRLWEQQIISIEKDNKILNELKEEFNGDYTLGIMGYYNITFTLYINTHTKNIHKITGHSSLSCSAKKNSSCYFKYLPTKFNMIGDLSFHMKKEYNDLYILAHSDFEYGNGIIYSNLINEKTNDYATKLPDETNHQYSTKIQKSRNFLHLQFIHSDPLLTIVNGTVPVLLFTIDCKEDCYFTFQVSEMKDHIKYLDASRENIFYGKKNSVSKIQYYNWKESKITLVFNRLIGSAKFKTSKSLNYDGLNSTKLEDFDMDMYLSEKKTLYT